MRLIDALRKNYADLASGGLRASAWKLDKPAIEQLRREAAAAGVDVSNTTTPPTFLGVPIEEVPMSGHAQADFVVHHCRFAPCQRLDRPQNQQWDIFDLNAAVAHGAFFATKAAAEAAAIALDIESPAPFADRR